MSKPGTRRVSISAIVPLLGEPPDSMQTRRFEFSGFEPTSGPKVGSGILEITGALRKRGAVLIEVTREEVTE
jgi:hypothetical protein